VVLLARSVALVYFGFTLYRTLRGNAQAQDASMNRTFKIFATCFTAWFFVLPFLVLLAHFLPSWTRSQIVTIISSFCDSVAYSGMLIVWRPNRGNRFVMLEDKSAGEFELCEMDLVEAA